MIFKKIGGVYQSLPYTWLGYKLLTGLQFVKLIISVPVIMIAGLIWPFYFLVRLWKHLVLKQPFEHPDEPYFFWGVKGGVWLNSFFFVVLYCCMPVLGYQCERERYETMDRDLKSLYNPGVTDGQHAVKPFVPPTERIPGYNFTEEFEKRVRESERRKAAAYGYGRGYGSGNDADTYQDNIDGYLDDPEDEISYPAEVFDASDD